MNCEICGKPADQKVEGHHLCDAHASAARQYEQRKWKRITCLEARAARLAQEGDTAIHHGFEIIKAIPMGQPILIGHYSERGHRALLRRSDNAIRRGIAAHDKAKHVRRRAYAAQSNRTISSDDPLAVIKLREKIASAERWQEEMKRVNSIIRKLIKPFSGKYPAHATGAEFSTYITARREYEKTYQQHAPKLAELAGIDEAEAYSLLRADELGRIGYATYQLSNNNANIKRMRERLAALEARAAAPAVSATTEYAWGRVIRDPADNRIRIVFPGKPESDVIAMLKHRGFHWSKLNGAWQRMLNGNGEWAASVIIAEMEKRTPTAQPEPPPKLPSNYAFTPDSGLTPIRQQYLSIKQNHPDALLAFRLGDYYEFFDEDAETAARVLDLVLTSRPISKDKRAPMAGFPHHALAQFLLKLRQAGYRVAVCEQINDPTGRGLVERKVVAVHEALLPDDAPIQLTMFSGA